MNFNLYLENLVEKKELPGGVLYVQQGNTYEFIKAYGSFTDQEGQVQQVTTDTLFDLASLTKVVATLPSILFLIGKRELSLEDSVQKIIPSLRFKHITIRHLLHHNSGLPADLPYRNRFESRDVLSDVLSEDLIYSTEEKVVYSDLGMILLGKIVEEISGEPLNEFTRKNIFEPWQLNNTTYLPSKEHIDQIASTEKVGDTYVQGEVHDEKAFHLGGVGGSAGVFSTAQDIGLYSKYWLGLEEQNVIPESLIELAQKDIFKHRGLRFEVLVEENQDISCGNKWPIGTFGHNGFTGTSVWMDPEHQLSVAFLTNIVHYGRDHKMKEIRQTLHSKIFEEIVLAK